jgi:hypothetical protein
MNKGFILDGFPRSRDDAELVFMIDAPVEKTHNGENDPEGAG